MREVDFLLESLVLLVGLYIQALITVFGDFLLEVLDGRLVLALGSFVGLYSRLGPFQDGLCARQLCLNGRHPLRQGSDLLVQAEDLFVGFL